MTPVVSRPTVEELLRVLTYPKFGLSLEDRKELLADYLPYAEVIELQQQEADLPQCRDPADRPSLGLAFAAGVDVSVTGDEHLLSMTGSFEFEIIRPTDLRHLVSP